MKNKTNASLRIILVLVAWVPLFIIPSIAQITWPSGQLLPSFPAPAKNQDLIYIRESSSRWEAEGSSLGHNTGHLDGDGWLCQTGIDAPNNHMIYGPYDNTIPAGPNKADFRIKVDNNTANNDPIVDIDVRDATSGAILAFQTITRQQFSIAGDYVTFTLPFTMPSDNQSLELRVYWHGASYTKVDYVSVQQNSSTPEMYLFASLKGIINRTQPRIFSYEGDAFAEGPYTWLQSLGMTWTEYSNNWDLITKYRNEIGGIIVYDPAQTATINLATVLAKDKKALIASPALLSKLTSAPYNLPVLLDLRGQFSSKLQVYQTLYNNYWPNLDHRLIIGLNPDVHKAALREYAVATGVATIWLDPDVAGESDLLNQFLASMPAGSNFMGWWPNEQPGVTRTSQYGITTIASDWSCNLTMHSGMPRTINIKPMPPKPALQNKIYVAFILSDGDNLQYVEHLMRKLWNNPDRGSVPMGWTVSPSMVDAMPGALNFYHQTATDNDNLISGPSGYGYTYPNSWPNQNALNQFAAKTDEYNRRAGLRVVTVWNTIVGGINQNVGQTYATYAPSLLGVTAQNTGGGLTIYNNSLPGMALSCNYCTGEQAMKDAIASAANGWNRNEPRFIIIQAQPWTDIRPTSFKNVANSLNSDYIVVRPDHIFQLIREKNGLPIDPTPPSTTGLVTVYKDCNFSSFSAGLDVGDYTLSQLQAKGVLDNDISSLKIKEGYKAILYDGDNFTGTSTVLTADMACSTEWNDKTTSIQIRTNGATNMAGVYFLQNKNSGLYADVWGLSTDDGANIAQGNFNGGANQQFQFNHLGDGTYQVLATHSMKSMDVNAISMDNGANVQQWKYNGTPNQQFILFPTSDGYYKLIPKHSGKVVEVVNASTANDANIQQYDNNNQNCGQWKLVAPVAVNGTGDGLTGSYFNGMNFETPVLCRKDANLSMDWGTGSPGTGVNTDQFTARWTGQIQPRYSGEYTFYINSDNGRRVWVNNQLIIDKWIDDWNIEYTGKIVLAAGQKYDIKVEYFENNGGANIKFEWSSLLQSREIVPASQLYSNPAPTVSITSPANNASFTAPASVTINVNADDNASVSKVDFYNGTTLLGSDNAAPYSFTWNNVSIGSYTLTAIATDNSGAFTISAPVAIAVKQDQSSGNGDGLTGNYFNGMNFETPKYSRKDAAINFDWGNGSPDPSINADGFSARWTGLIQPRYSETYTFYLNTDNGRRLWINNQLIVDKWIDDWGTEYSGTIALQAGRKYEIKLEYFEDWGGANCKMEWSSASQTRQVVPQSQLYSNALPVISISSPTNNSSSITPANLSLAVNVSDADGSVSKVDYYNGTTLIASTTSPFTYSWNNVAAGSYSITAIATDNRGGVAVSAPVSVTVKSATNQAPTVSITSPANNSSYNAPASIAFSANASDADGTVSKVEFFNGGSSIGFATQSPYNVEWSNVAAGTYTITAKATDNSNATTTSATITITVKSVSSNTCSGIPQYVENAGYVDGSKVQNAGSSYQCKPYPYTGWCNGAAWAYAPGTGAYWADAWALIGSCTASAPTVSASPLLIPNPATDYLTINLNESSKVTIYNAMGNVVLPTTSIGAKGTINIADLSGGIYDVRIETSGQVINVRLVKN